MHKSSIQDAEIKNQLDDIQTLLEDAIQQTRSMTFELSPPLLYEIGLDALSSHELETLQLLAESNTTKQIASELFISAKTVESHRQSIMKKLKIYNMTDLVKFAIREGITL